MNNKQEKTNNQQYQFILRGAIVGGTVGGAIALSQQQSHAITVADVTAGIDTVTTGADTTADTALPIGLGILAISIIGMVLRRFIMV